MSSLHMDLHDKLVWSRAWCHVMTKPSSKKEKAVNTAVSFARSTTSVPSTMDPSQQQNDQQQQPHGGDEQEEFQFDPEEHQVLTLDEALEIFDDGSVPPSQEDLEREEQEAAQQALEDDEEPEDLRPDTSVAHFASHDGSIFGLAAHPVEPLLVASGGEDDLAFLWRMDNGEQVAKLSGHSDSVSCVAFSADGELVSTGGMDGKVRLWRRVKGVAGFEWGKWEFLTSLDGPDEVTVSETLSFAFPVFECQGLIHLLFFFFQKTLVWHPRGQVLTAGSTDGTIWMWNRKFVSYFNLPEDLAEQSG